MTTKGDIKLWLKYAIARNCNWMIVVCDSYDYSDYPIYIKTKKEYYQVYEAHNGKDMQKIMEVYDLNMDIEYQLNERRANHPPEGAKDETSNEK